MPIGRPPAPAIGLGLLIEKAPRFRNGGYAVDFWGVGYTVAERMGILPEVRARGYIFQEVRDVDERGLRVGGFRTHSLLRLAGASSRPSRVAGS